MEILFWTIIFIVSLAILIKGAGWLLASAEKIGLAAGLSPFVLGAIIVGAGTSFPELISSLFAVFRNVTEIVAADVVGSNIANILLIVGFAAVVGRQLVITKNIIDLDLPFLSLSTVLGLGVMWDRKVTFFESLILLAALIIYLLYTIFHKDEIREEIKEEIRELKTKPKLAIQDFIYLAAGILSLALGAHYLIESVIRLSAILNIGAGVIAITAVAVGTSLPEFIVSVKAALQKKPDIAIGNVLGSNVFNMLVVVGLPGLFKNLSLDEQTFSIGIPTMALATLLFVISGISKKFYKWEGGFYLLIYLVFLMRLFEFI